MSVIKTTTNKIRFALVGCGRIAGNHVEALSKYANDCELVAVCDIDSNALKTMAERTSAMAYTDLQQMLVDGGFDAVILTTPSGLHAAQTVACAEHGYHVITEKPMATKFEDGVKMVQACDKAGVMLFVVKQNRLNKTTQLVKKALESGRFGRIYNVACNVFWTRPQEYYDQAKWRGTWEFDGGAFMNQASHYVDLLRWLFGEVLSVQSYVATQARNIEVEDSGVAIFKWKSGAVGTMNVSMLTYPKNLEGSLTIIGENGTVKLGGVALNEVSHWEFKDGQPQEKEAMINAGYVTESVYGFGHQLYYANVIKALQGLESPLVDGYAGLTSLEILIAIYRAAQSGTKVSLPLIS